MQHTSPPYRTLAWILLCEGLGILGSFATRNSISSWYFTLEKPSFTPPPFIFGPVWTILYITLGVAADRITKSSTPTWIKTLFFIHLAANFSWSFIFFGAQSILGGHLLLLFMNLSLWILLIGLGRYLPRIGLLLIPYACWILFAEALTSGILWQHLLR